jgi:DnaK suppressor protein
MLMTQEQLAKYKNRLETLLRGIRPHLEDLREETPSHDTGDVAHATADKEALSRWESVRATTAKLITAALRRLDDGVFGVCMNCEKGISLKRLDAIPWATLCIRCQEDADRHKQHKAPKALKGLLANSAWSA